MNTKYLEDAAAFAVDNGFELTLGVVGVIITKEYGRAKWTHVVTWSEIQQGIANILVLKMQMEVQR